MSRQSSPNIVIHSPSSPEKKSALDVQVARAHATQVERYIQGLNIPSTRKKQLVDAILTSGREL